MNAFTLETFASNHGMLLGGELFRALRHESQIVDYALFRRFIHPVVLVWSLALMILAETLLA